MESGSTSNKALLPERAGSSAEERRLYTTTVASERPEKPGGSGEGADTGTDAGPESSDPSRHIIAEAWAAAERARRAREVEEVEQALAGRVYLSRRAAEPGVQWREAGYYDVAYARARGWITASDWERALRDAEVFAERWGVDFNRDQVASGTGAPGVIRDAEQAAAIAAEQAEFGPW